MIRLLNTNTVVERVGRLRGVPATPDIAEALFHATLPQMVGDDAAGVVGRDHRRQEGCRTSRAKDQIGRKNEIDCALGGARGNPPLSRPMAASGRAL